MDKIRSEIQLDFIDVLIEPREGNVASRSEVSLETTYKFKNSGQLYTGIPIVASNMDTVGTFEMAKAFNQKGLFTTLHKHYQPEDWVEFAVNNSINNLALSIGIGQADQAKMEKILSLVPGINFICIDVANGYTNAFLDFIRQTRANYPTKTIIAGNVVHGYMVERLLEAGADIIKVGIGSGSVCTTRKKAGVGRPQLSAVLECAQAAHRLDGHIMSDGGCTDPADVGKAFGAGAHFVMLGGMLAGHDQSNGQVQTDDSGQKWKLFYGMSSKHAQEKYNGGLADYRASEGKVVKIPYRGDVNITILDILGGVRSSCTYTGSSKLQELSVNTTFTIVNRQTNEIFSGRETK